ncbi:MAG: hypothetical protein JWO57_2798 [Pseudonocardiales bacterium]|nr:hypothetical protein [Pseudonocardiales bacterium]
MATYSVDANMSGSLLQDVALSGLDNMKMDLSGGTTTTLAGETTVHSDAAVTIEPITLEPITTSSTVQSTSSLDLKPVAVDSCVRLELGPPPATDVCMPYAQRWALSLLGVELMALTVSGESSTTIRPAKRPSGMLGLDERCGCEHEQVSKPHPIVLEL